MHLKQKKNCYSWPDEHTNYIAVDESLGNVIATSTSSQENVVNVGDGPVQALEIVPGLATGAIGQGAFLITQPQLNPGITFAPGQIPTDHIIVHTLPIQQVYTSCLFFKILK